MNPDRSTSTCSARRRHGIGPCRRVRAGRCDLLTAAFTGLRRGEPIALRWRDADFTGCVIRVRASYSAGALATPKSGKLRSVPMAPQVAETLARFRRTATDDGLAFLGGGGGYRFVQTETTPDRGRLIEQVM